MQTLSRSGKWSRKQDVDTRRKIENMGTYADDKMFVKKPWSRTVSTVILSRTYRAQEESVNPN
eukprot:4607153-Pyramimonas_sp.AAC.1